MNRPVFLHDDINVLFLPFSLSFRERHSCLFGIGLDHCAKRPWRVCAFLSGGVFYI